MTKLLFRLFLAVSLCLASFPELAAASGGQSHGTNASITPDAGGWITLQATATYASATTITMPAGSSTYCSKGTRVQFVQTTTKYGTVITCADTLWTLAANSDYSVANAAISSFKYSREAAPVGYPGKF